MIELAMLVVPGAFHGGVAAMLDGFALASERRTRIMGEEGGPERTDMALTVLTADGGPVRLDRRVELKADRAIATTDRFDLVWIPAFRGGEENALRERIAESREMLDWIAAQARGGSIIASSGTANALVLAAGLGRKKAVPIVPALVPTFRALFPRVKIDDDREIVDADGVLLGRGTASDLELIARSFDRLLSPAAGHWLRSVLGHMPTTREETSGDPLVETARLWLEQRFSGPVSIAELAAELNIGQAALTRRFKAGMGLTPSAFVTRLRLNTAKRMLSQSRRSIESISAAVGFNDARNFRQQFREAEGISASAWRAEQAVK